MSMSQKTAPSKLPTRQPLPSGSDGISSELTLEEQRIYEFLLRLKSANVLSGWDEQFVNDLLSHPRPITRDQRIAVDNLRAHWEAHL